MSRIFFIADTHFGHGNIIKYCHRPFLSEYDKQVLAQEGQWHDGNWKGEGSSRHKISDQGIRMMDDTLIDNINTVVGEKDTLYHLGDFCFGIKGNVYHKAAEYRNRIKCDNVHLIWGNHDDYKIRDLFSSTHDRYNLWIGEQLIILHHYAQAVWDGSHRGSWNLYGHSHAGAEPWMDANMPGRRSMDVGVDNAVKILGAYRPFSLEEVKEIMSKRSGFSMDHHIPRNSKAPTEESLANR